MKKTTRKRTGRWLLYVLKCVDNTLYTGITNDLARRLEQHSSGKASRYTRSRLPIRLVYTEGCRDKSYALKKELRIKALSRQEKEVYIQRCTAGLSQRRTVREERNACRDD